VAHQRFTLLASGKVHVRVSALQLRKQMTVADDEFGARQIEVQKRRQILFGCNAGDAQKYRARQIDRRSAPRSEQCNVDAASPHCEPFEPICHELSPDVFGGDHSRARLAMEAPQNRVGP